MHEFAVEEPVLLVPTQGGHQMPIAGKVAKVSKTRVVVVDDKRSRGVTYRRADGPACVPG